MSTRFKAGVSAVVLVVTPLALAATSTSADAAARTKFSSCSQLEKVFPHGVAKSTAAANAQVAQGYGRPSTSARAKKVYRVNKGSLDRDKDGTACER